MSCQANSRKDINLTIVSSSQSHVKLLVKIDNTSTVENKLYSSFSLAESLILLRE